MGAPDRTSSNAGDGSVFVYFGGSSGLNGGANGSSSSYGWSTYGETTGARYGFAVATGDTDNDGYFEILIGAPIHEYNSGSPYYYTWDAGKAYLFEGTSSGLNGSTSWQGASTQNGGQFGYSVALLDVNESGADIVVGAPAYDNGSTDEGVVFIWHGVPGTAGTTGNYTTLLEKNQGSAKFGFCVAGGDIDNDGYQDLLAGAPDYDNGQTDEGAVFVYHGSSTGVSSSNWSGESNQADSHFGWSVAAGNLTSYVLEDLHDDIAVGSPYYDYATTTDGGGTFIWYGSGSGLGSNGTPGNSDFAAYNLSNNGCHSGWSLVVGDDVGYARAGVIIGSPDEDGGGQTDRGAVNIFIEPTE